MPQVDENGNFLVYIPENGYPTMSSDENADENDFWKWFLKKNGFFEGALRMANVRF